MKRVLAFACLWAWGLGASGPEWLATNWHGEKAQVLRTPPWVAVVSLDRGRLVEFRPTGSSNNFLHAPVPREKNRWGGHRVWLGPQRLWSAPWPPPEAWEHQAPARAEVMGDRLTLTMAGGVGDWPSLSRSYCPKGSDLACGVRVEGGKRSGQIMQIFQVPLAAVIRAPSTAGKGIPQGAFLLPAAAGPEAPALQFQLPAGVTFNSGTWTVGATTNIFRLGLARGPMELRHGNRKVTLLPDGEPPLLPWTADTDPPGILFSNPGRGFHEAEQLSRPFKPGEAMDFSVFMHPETP